jgi:prepilin-type N-terminal cleavage/methylation domain-containing protein
MRDDAGFTLIELMIVIAIIAIIAAIAIPNLLSARLSSNETAAVATLRNIVSAQSQFQVTGRADENLNGIGEYGYLAELSGAIGVRGGAPLQPAVLSTAFRSADANGVVTRSGYLYILSLPDAGGDAMLPTHRDGGSRLLGPGRRGGALRRGVGLRPARDGHVDHRPRRDRRDRPRRQLLEAGRVGERPQPSS